MYVNVNNDEVLEFGETAKITTSRSNLGAISLIYRFENGSMHGSTNFWSRGRGVLARLSEKSSEFFFRYFSSQFILQRDSNDSFFKEYYHLTIIFQYLRGRSDLRSISFIGTRSHLFITQC